MLRNNLVANLTLMALALTDVNWADDRRPLPPSARVRLEPLNVCAGDEMVSLCFLRDGKTIIWKNRDYTIHHWDLATATEVGQFAGDDWWSHDFPQQFSILQATDHRRVLHSAAHSLAMLDLETGQERFLTELARFKPSWISPDSKRIVTYEKQGSWSKRTATATFTLWDLQRAEKFVTSLIPSKTLPKKRTPEQNSRR